MSFKVKIIDEYEISCDIVQMGEDLMAAVYGGSRPHIGSTVMAIPRPSLTGSGIGVTSSVLNAVGHKDEYAARFIAEKLAVKINSTVVCSCGIHIDDISEEQLKAVKKGIDDLLLKIFEKI